VFRSEQVTAAGTRIIMRNSAESGTGLKYFGSERDGIDTKGSVDS
jgi:hypothetical protein